MTIKKCKRPIEVLFEGADTEIYKSTKEFSKDLVDELKGIEEDFCFLICRTLVTRWTWT